MDNLLSVLIYKSFSDAFFKGVYVSFYVRLLLTAFPKSGANPLGVFMPTDTGRCSTVVKLRRNVGYFLPCSAHVCALLYKYKIIYARKNEKKCKKVYIFLFFILAIRFNSQKCIIFALRFEKRCKISINFLNMQVL